MGRTNDNAVEAKKKANTMTLNQLKKWNVKYHKIFFGKPSTDFYIVIRAAPTPKKLQT